MPKMNPIPLANRWVYKPGRELIRAKLRRDMFNWRRY